MTMNADTVSVLEGNSFVAGKSHGLFQRGTRHLSRLLLTIDSTRLETLYDRRHEVRASPRELSGG
jgi:hypothetical protein